MVSVSRNQLPRRERSFSSGSRGLRVSSLAPDRRTVLASWSVTEATAWAGATACAACAGPVATAPIPIAVKPTTNSPIIAAIFSLEPIPVGHCIDT